MGHLVFQPQPPLRINQGLRLSQPVDHQENYLMMMNLEEKPTPLVTWILLMKSVLEGNISFLFVLRLLLLVDWAGSKKYRTNPYKNSNSSNA